MTAPALIKKADMDRVFSSVADAKFENARVIIDLRRGRIEVIIGDQVQAAPVDEWDDGDDGDD